MVTLILDDESDEILIAKSGAPYPSPALVAWLDETCAGGWSVRVDHVFNVYFTFDDANAAEAFRLRFGARET
jgi:hypothetical protein